MATWKCSVCGYVYDEDKEGKPFSELDACPVCKQPASVFEALGNAAAKAGAGTASPAEAQAPDNPLAYPAEYARRDESCRYMKEIHEMAVSGKSIIEAMGTKMPMPSWDDILILGAQLNPPPLMEHSTAR